MNLINKTRPVILLSFDIHLGLLNIFPQIIICFHLIYHGVTDNNTHFVEILS